MNGSRSVAVGVFSLALSGFVLIYVLAVLTPTGQAVDNDAMTALSMLSAESGWAYVLLALISPVSLLAGTGLVGWCGYRRGGWRAAAVVTAVALGTALAAQILKLVLVRPELAYTASNSLPSGHVAAVAGLAVAASMASHRAWRPMAVALGAVAVTATGLATITLTWHRPSDVVASLLLAVAASALAPRSLAPIDVDTDTDTRPGASLIEDENTAA